HTDLRADDAEAIIQDSAFAIASAPAINRSVVLRREGLNRTTGLTGTTVGGLRITNIRARSGRLFDNNDDDERRSVALLGPVVALVLGAVGILTVMLMSVRERTREIGLRRALGASQKDIRIQFLVESAMLGGTGGAAGVLVGIVGSWAAAFLGGWNLIISWDW